MAPGATPWAVGDSNDEIFESSTLLGVSLSVLRRDLRGTKARRSDSSSQKSQRVVVLGGEIGKRLGHGLGFVRRFRSLRLPPGLVRLRSRLGWFFNFDFLRERKRRRIQERKISSGDLDFKKTDLTLSS